MVPLKVSQPTDRPRAKILPDHGVRPATTFITRTSGGPLPARHRWLTVAVSPRSPLALVLDTYPGQVRPVNLATGQALRRIHVGAYPLAAVIAP
jgi:hypothetical protein